MIVRGTLRLTVSLVFIAFFMAAGVATAGPSCETDFNGDGVTDEADFEILKEYMGSNEDLDGFAADIDLNGDGQVDLADATIFGNCN